MSKFIVIKGRNPIVGLVKCDYSIFDVVTFTADKEITELMKDYVCYKLTESYKTVDETELTCRRKNIMLGDGRIFAESVKVFDYYKTFEYFGFIPVERFMEYES